MSTQFPWQDPTLSLAERNEKLSRTTQAMWQLLKSKLNLRDEDLRYALQQIELAQPESADRLLNCPICRHPLRSTAKSCIYCGTGQHPKYTNGRP